MLCRHLGLKKAVDWFGLTMGLYIPWNYLERFNFHDVVIMDLTCPSGAKRFEECTYRYAKNISQCTNLENSVQKSVRVIQGSFLAVVCAPRAGMFQK